jgi:hypothetical protein
MSEHEAVVKDLRDGTLTIIDGTGTPVQIELVLDEGDLAFEIVPGGKEKKEHLDRGILSHVRHGDQKSVPVKFSLKFREFISASGVTPKTVFEAITKTGQCASLTSVNTDNGGVYMLKLQFDIATPTTGEDPERITFNKVYFNKVAFQEGDPNKLSVEAVDFETSPTIAKVSSATTTAGA